MPGLDTQAIQLEANEKIDFPLPAIIKNTMEDTEEALREYGEYGPYIDWVDTLDNVCKECYVSHIISRSQWKKIMSRYPV